MSRLISSCQWAMFSWYMYVLVSTVVIVDVIGPSSGNEFRFIRSYDESCVNERSRLVPFESFAEENPRIFVLASSSLSLSLSLSVFLPIWFVLGEFDDVVYVDSALFQRTHALINSFSIVADVHVHCFHRNYFSTTRSRSDSMCFVTNTEQTTLQRDNTRS
jgi:hypothetical protein